ncbi:MAG: DUF364 domain-containing protein [Sphingobacterium sp.]|nr:DUF364 domain-containing protein [Sphingobacterium sp.]
MKVFDKLFNEPEIRPQSQLLEEASKSDCLILTATSIFNNTFMELVNHTQEGNDTFVLDPSAILHRDMFLYRNIKMVFGVAFSDRADQLIEIVAKGGGTRDFLPLARKVFIRN